MKYDIMDRSIIIKRLSIAILLAIICPFAGYTQNLQAPVEENLVWTDDRQPGIADLDTSWAIFRDGSVEFSTTTFRLLKDEAFRNSVYPEVYTLLSLPDQLEENHIAFALWILINKVDERPVDVMEIVYKLSRVGIGSRHYLQAFYTYAFSDPEVYDFGEEGITMMKPRLLEEKLERCKNLMALSDKYMKMSIASE